MSISRLYMLLKRNFMTGAQSGHPQVVKEVWELALANTD
jgi:hypothetical protein